MKLSIYTKLSTFYEIYYVTINLVMEQLDTKKEYNEISLRRNVAGFRLPTG